MRIRMASVLPLLLLCIILLALCTPSLSDDHVLVSIDCGSSTATYTDDNGIEWTGDDKYVKSGESRSVRVPSESATHVMSTLRVFTNNKTKNCYTIDSGKPGRVLVRASFYYGNYDGKNSPPRLRLLFDEYDWGGVNNSGSTPFQFEVIYVTKKESIDVCVAAVEQGQFPYISALEVRRLEPYMYNAVKDTVQLYTRRRVAFGAKSNTTIRFPEDPYDRIWRSDSFPPEGTIKVSSNAPLNSGMNLAALDNPPPAVLNTAITSANPLANSTIDLFLATPMDYSAYLNLYFSEVTRLKPNQTRSFYFARDNRPFPTPVSPPYGNCTQLYASNMSVFENTTFSLVPTNNSALPPLINAMEVYRLEEFLDEPTSKKDVQGLGFLQEAFSSLEDWTGDPCLPLPKYAWNWVKCNYDELEPRVTTLLLGGYGLSGLLPDFSSMDALQTINLSNNSLQGEIPDFLGMLPNLQILNIENNQFNGTIPASLTTKKGLILRVSGNPDLCASNTSCSVPVAAPKANASTRKMKSILETLFAAIITSIIVLHLS